MIQRIQTLYLLAVTVLATVFCFFAFAQVESSPVAFSTAGALHCTWLIPSAILSILIPAISFGSIFLYRRRILQMRLISFEMILTVLMYLADIVVLVVVHRTAPEAEIHITWMCTIPPTNLILSYLAIRRIAMDEALVQAADRLR